MEPERIPASSRAVQYYPRMLESITPQLVNLIIESKGKNMESGSAITPVLFYTLANGNPQSVQVLATLKKLLLETCEDKPVPRCWAFGSEEEARNHFRERDIVPERAVALFDNAHISGKCFSPICRMGKRNCVRMPTWIAARWAVAIKAGILQQRIRTVALQIRADFCRNFTERVANDQFPWGSRPTTPQSGRKKRERKSSRGISYRSYSLAR